MNGNSLQISVTIIVIRIAYVIMFLNYESDFYCVSLLRIIICHALSGAALKGKMVILTDMLPTGSCSK